MATDPPAHPADGTNDDDRVHDRLAETASEPETAKPSSAAGSPSVRPRPEVVHGYTHQLVAPEGKVNVTLNSDAEGLLEIFINVGKAGSDIAALAEAVGRLVSLILRLPSPLPPNERAADIVHQLKGIGGSRAVGLGPEEIRSLPDAVARALEYHLTSRAGDGVPAPDGSP